MEAAFGGDPRSVSSKEPSLGVRVIVLCDYQRLMEKCASVVGFGLSFCDHEIEFNAVFYWLNSSGGHLGLYPRSRRNN